MWILESLELELFSPMVHVADDNIFGEGSFNPLGVSVIASVLLHDFMLTLQTPTVRQLGKDIRVPQKNV